MPPFPNPAKRRYGELVFVGGFKHDPNVDAMLYFCHEVMPRIAAARPHARLKIIGSHPPPAIQALAGEHVDVLGFVPETAPYLESAYISVAPLRYGGGMKGKVGEAMSFGLPVVTTSYGAEGFGLRPDEDLLIGDTADSFTAKVIALLDDANLHNRIARRGYNFIEEHFSVPAVEQRLALTMQRLTHLPLRVIPLRRRLDAACASLVHATHFLAAAWAMSSAIVIVVLNWNGAEDTLACLDSLQTLAYPNFQVVVVDNGSTDDSLAKLQGYHASFPMTILATGSNLGYAGGNNVGTRYAMDHGADFVLLLNNDTTVAPDLLDRLITSAGRNADAGVFSARVLYFDAPARVWFDGARWNESSLQLEWPGQGAPEAELGMDEHDTDYASGAALFFRADVVRKIGLLDEAFFLVWEEVDWCFRARAAGWRIIVVPEARVRHKIGVSFGNESSPLRTYFSTRNELLWFQRHASLNARIRLALKSLRQLAPKFRIAADSAASFPKRLYWGIQDYVQSWVGRGSRLEYLSKRRAIIDYVRGRFGNCPPEVRAWSHAWAQLDKTS